MLVTAPWGGDRVVTPAETPGARAAFTADRQPGALDLCVRPLGNNLQILLVLFFFCGRFHIKLTIEPKV